ARRSRRRGRAQSPLPRRSSRRRKEPPNRRRRRPTGARRGGQKHACYSFGGGGTSPSDDLIMPQPPPAPLASVRRKDGRIAKAGSRRVLLREHRSLGGPRDGEIRIVPADAALGVGRVRRRALVEEDRL